MVCIAEKATAVVASEHHCGIDLLPVSSPNNICCVAYVQTSENGEELHFFCSCGNLTFLSCVAPADVPTHTLEFVDPEYM